MRCVNSDLICRWQEAFGPNFADIMRVKCKDNDSAELGIDRVCYGFPSWVDEEMIWNSKEMKPIPQFQKVLYDQDSILPNGQHLCFWPNFDYMLTLPKFVDTQPGIPVTPLSHSHSHKRMLTKKEMRGSCFRYKDKVEHFALINGFDNSLVKIQHPGLKIGSLINTELLQLGFKALQALPCVGHVRVPESMLRAKKFCYDCCKYRVTRIHAAQSGKMIYVHRERKHPRCTGTESTPNCKLVVKSLAELRVTIKNTSL